MVSWLSIVMMCLSLLLAIGFPLALAIYFYKKNKYSISAVFIGALCFAIFQVFTRIPLITYLSNQPWFTQTVSSNVLAASIFAAGTAGLFEEVGRFILYKTLMKRKLSWENSIAFGIGHGGIEAFLLLGMTMALNLYYSITINTGYFDSVLAQSMPAMTAIGIRGALISTPSYLFIIGGIERVLTIIVHIGFSVTVMYGVMSNKLRYLAYAILAHALLNFPIGLVINQRYGILIIELYLAALAIVSLVCIVRFRKMLWAKQGEEAHSCLPQ